MRRWRWLFRVLGVLRSAFPVAVLAVLLPLSAGEAARDAWVGGLLMLLAGASLWSFHAGASAYRESGDFIRTLKSLGVPGWQIAVTTLRLSTASIAVQLGAQMSSLLTLTFVVEYALGLPGLGTRTVEALRDPDLNWLMAITISTALFVGVLQVLSELLSNVLDPRWQDASKRLGGSA
jgi:ABC-type dipeptide/oligopeptide/nickel transport system permease component